MPDDRTTEDNLVILADVRERASTTLKQKDCRHRYGIAEYGVVCMLCDAALDPLMVLKRYAKAERIFLHHCEKTRDAVTHLAVKRAELELQVKNLKSTVKRWTQKQTELRNEIRYFTD